MSRRLPSRGGAAVLALSCLLGCSACGGASNSSSSSGAPTAPQASYAGSTAGLAVYVNWADAKGQLTGALRRSYIVGGKRERVLEQSFPVVGTVSGSLVSLHGTTTGANFSGAFAAPTELDLNNPTGASSYAAVRMQAGGVGAYDQEVATLQAQAAASNAARLAAARARSAKLRDIKLAQVVKDDLYSLNAILAQASDDGAAAAVAPERTASAQTAAAAAVVSSEAKRASPRKLCNDANAVAIAANHVDAARAIVLGDAQGATQTAGLIQTTLQQLEEDGAKLQSRRNAIPTYVPRSAPSASKVTAASQSADSTAQQIGGSAAASLQTANALAQTARGQAKAARAACLKVAKPAT
jgi:hypothetical protein